MVFLAPWMLWALPFALLPLLIHLINRWRHRSIDWAAMDFIIRVTRERRGRKKLIHYLILVMRVLAVLMLVTAMARPLMSHFMGWGTAGINEVVLLLDRSPSMGAMPDGRTSLQQTALPLVEGMMDKLDTTGLVLIDSVTQTPVHVADAGTLPSLAVTRTTDVASDIPGLLDKAVTHLRESGSPESEIWIASDMQASNWKPDSPRWDQLRSDLLALPSTPAIRLISLRQRPTGNKLVRVDKALVLHQRLHLELTISREQTVYPADETMPVTISIDNSPITHDIPLTGETTRLVRQFDLPPGQRTGFGYVALPHDNQPRDDQYFFTYAPSRGTSVLVVSPPGPAARTVRTMAAPPGLEDKKSERTDARHFPDLTGYSLIVWMEELPEGGQADKLLRYIRQGGAVLFLPPPSGQLSDTRFLGVTWTPPDFAPAEEYFHIETWNRASGVLRDSAGNHSLPVKNVMAVKRQGIDGPGETLAAWTDGARALVRAVDGRGEALFLSTIPDYAWSNLAEGHLLLPLLQRLAQEANDRTSDASSLLAGSADIPRRADALPRRLDDFEPAAGRDTSSPQRDAGVYALGTRTFCVNRSPLEDDPEQLSAQQLSALLPDIVISDAAGYGQSDLASEVWKPFLIATLLFLLAEALLCLPPSGNTRPDTPS